MHNLVYALIQVVHNLGAAAVVGLSTYGLWQGNKEATAQRRIFIAVGIAWLIQGMSGAAFGISSLSFYGKLPDIHGIAIDALLIKISCVIAGLIITALVLRRGNRPGGSRFAAARIGLFGLAVTALSAAAFLRWFS